MIAWLIVTLHRRLVAANSAFDFTVWCWGLVLGSGVGVWCWGLVLGSGVLRLYQADAVSSRVRQRCPEDAVGAAGVRGHRVVAGGINNQRTELTMYEMPQRSCRFMS
jgi:hypothetical protein